MFGVEHMVFGTGIGRFAQPGEEKGDLAVFSYLWEGTGKTWSLLRDVPWRDKRQGGRFGRVIQLSRRNIEFP